MASRDDHYDIGWAHALSGLERYKFQDPILQERYDKGYNDASSGKLRIESVLREQQTIAPGLPGRIKRY